MIECVQIYEGEFESGGAVGTVIKTAFDGAFLSEQEEAILLSEKVLKNYNGEGYGYLTADYEKWLVVLHLYTRQQYALLVKYLQREIFACEDDLTQFLLRYNVAVVYYLLGDFAKGLNVFKGLLKYEDKFEVKAHIDKIAQAEFDADECLQELREEIGIGCSKLLSNYLPYRPVSIPTALPTDAACIKVYMRMLIPFPAFESPSLRLAIDSAFILA
jgi:tetratricopeptide (TPR) repeat protein